MSTEAENTDDAALRGAQRASEHILTAAEVAAMRGRHYEFEAKYCDDDGDIVLREMICPFCSEPWPCEMGEMLAQDGRWRARVRELLAAMHAWLAYEADHRAVRPRAQDRRLLAALAHAQAALDGGAE